MGWLVAFIITSVATVVIVYQSVLLSDANHSNANQNNPPRRQNTVSNAVNNIQRTLATGSNSETGAMIYFANDRHGLADKEYRFNYKRVGGTWRAYILKTPNIRGRSGSVPHTLHDNNGAYICWSGTVNSLRDIQNISRVWADRAQNYLATGSW